MDTSYTTPTYQTLLGHRGRALAVVPEPCRLVDDVELVLEDLSTPWEYDGVLTFEARFTGPAGRPLQADFYRLRSGDQVFVLHLEDEVRMLRRRVLELEGALRAERENRPGVRVFAAGASGVIPMASGRRIRRSTEVVLWRPGDRRTED